MTMKGIVSPLSAPAMTSSVSVKDERRSEAYWQRRTNYSGNEDEMVWQHIEK